MCVIEGQLESYRRELAARTDFNLFDTFKMFVRGQFDKKGIDCDDVYDTIMSNLEVQVSKDEIFILFYKVDKDADGFWNQDECQNAFLPRDRNYANLVRNRGGIYGDSDFKNYFRGQTRESLRKYIRQFCECEISIELIRQRIANKSGIRADAAF